MQQREATSVLPVHCWNTAVSCLACLADSLSLDLPFEHVAGLSGEAFRLPLFANTAPGSWQHSVSWPHAALNWMESLGIDAEICWTDSAAASADNWLSRQRTLISETLGSGLPVMYWDNLAWAVILAEDADSYLVSGIPALHIPDGLPHAEALRRRSFGVEGHGPDGAFRIPREELRPLFEGDQLFIHPRGLAASDPEYRLAMALARAANELGGVVNWPRLVDSSGQRLSPLFGTAAMERLAMELKGGEPGLDGLISSMQTLLEMRRAALRWLSDLVAETEGELQPRLKQAAEFMRRIVAGLRPVAADFALPADPRTQLRKELLERNANALYEVRRTEETLTRLLRGISGDFGVFS